MKKFIACICFIAVVACTFAMAATAAVTEIDLIADKDIENWAFTAGTDANGSHDATMSFDTNGSAIVSTDVCWPSVKYTFEDAYSLDLSQNPKIVATFKVENASANIQIFFNGTESILVGHSINTADTENPDDIAAGDYDVAIDINEAITNTNQTGHPIIDKNGEKSITVTDGKIDLTAVSLCPAGTNAKLTVTSLKIVYGEEDSTSGSDSDAGSSTADSSTASSEESSSTTVSSSTSATASSTASSSGSSKPGDASATILIVLAVVAVSCGVVVAVKKRR